MSDRHGRHERSISSDSHGRHKNRAPFNPPNGRRKYRDESRERDERGNRDVEDRRRNKREDGKRYRSRSPADRPSQQRRDSFEDNGRRRRYSDYDDSYQRSKSQHSNSHSPPRRTRQKSPYRSPPRRMKYESPRSRSPPHRQARPRSRSPPDRKARPPPHPPPTIPYKRSKNPLPSQNDAFAGKVSPSTSISVPGPTAEKQKPNFAPSGLLAAETNTVAGTSIILKYNEPPESRKPPPTQPWRLYVFKGAETLDTVELASRSCWLFGRERSVVDFPIEHPSCSKQHAVLQFRHTERKNEFGDREAGVRPYVIDLESANGTRVNGEGVPERRYVEVRSGDVLAFGESTREYVLMLPPRG